MYRQVRNTVGIHMSTLKGGADVSDAVDAVVGDAPEDMDISGWAPLPAQMSEWQTKV